MYLTPLTFVVIVASVLGGSMALPQARKLLRTRRLEGVSMTWAAMSATVNAWWAVYGIAIGDLAIVPVSVVSVMAYLVIALGIGRFSAMRPLSVLTQALAPSIAVSIVPVVALVASGWLVAGIALGALYGVQLAPAVIAVYRAVDVSGVSPATWVIGFAEAGLWGVYGAAGRDVGIMTLAVTGLTMAALVLVRLLLRRPRRHPASRAALVPSFATV